MSFFCRLSRKHYWCIPHRSADNRLVQVCYECGAERPAREFHNEIAGERYNQAVASARSEMMRMSSRRIDDEPPQRMATQERIAVGEGRVRKFSLVK
jgi:hypothetical protein